MYDSQARQITIEEIQAKLDILAQREGPYLIMETDQIADHLDNMTKREFSFTGQPDRLYIDENYLKTLRNSEFSPVYSYFTGLDKEIATEKLWEYYLYSKENNATIEAAHRYRGAEMRVVWTWLIGYHFAKDFGYLTEEQKEELYNYTTQLTEILYEAKGHREGIPEELKTIPDIDFTDYTKHNYHAEVMGLLFYYALVFPESPNSARYFQYAVEQTEMLMEVSVFDGGAWHESPRYAGAILRTWVPLFEDLRRLTGLDWFQNAGFRSMLHYFVKTETPAHLEREEGLSTEESGYFIGRSPALGDAIWSTDWYIFLAYAAYSYRELDPEFAGNLMYAWRQSGSPNISHRIKETYTIGNLDPEIESVAPDNQSFVVSWKKGNVILQNDRQGEDEKWLLFRCGADSLTPTPLSSHQHSDKNSFSLFAYGYPMLLDLGVGEYEEEETEFYRSTPAHNLVHFAKFIQAHPVFVELYGTEQTQFTTTEGELVKFETDADNDLVCGKVLKSGWVDESGTPTPSDTYEYTRSVFFAKPDYFIIRDVIGEDSEADQIFNGLCLGDIEISGNIADFHHPAGNVGLKIIVLNGEDLSFESGTVPLAQSQWAKELKSLRVTSQNPKEKGFLTLLYPYRDTDPDLKAEYLEEKNEIHVFYGDREDVITFNDDTQEWSRNSITRILSK